MPELPAVEFSRRLVDQYCLGRMVISTELPAGPDTIIFGKDVSGGVETLKQLKGLKISATGRWGKQLWFSFSGDQKEDFNTSSKVVLLMHLGMTGFLQVRGVDRLYYKSSPTKPIEEEEEMSNNDEDGDGDGDGDGKTKEIWPPRFTKVLFEFEDEIQVAFGDARRLGRVELVTISSDISIVDFVRNRTKIPLGFDPLLAMPSSDEFLSLSQSKRFKNQILKRLLLDQSFAAGVGNWMADDILLMARLHPEDSLINLTPEQLESFRIAIYEVSSIAVQVNANGDEFPREWLFHVRWMAARARSKSLKTLAGEVCHFEKIAGRQTLWIPRVQSKSKKSK